MSTVRGNLRSVNDLMQQQQKHLQSRAAQLQDLQDKLASEAAARQALSSELTVLRDRCDTLRTQVYYSSSSTMALLRLLITRWSHLLTLMISRTQRESTSLKCLVVFCCQLKVFSCQRFYGGTQSGFQTLFLMQLLACFCHLMCSPVRAQFRHGAPVCVERHTLRAQLRGVSHGAHADEIGE